MFRSLTRTKLLEVLSKVNSADPKEQFVLFKPLFAVSVCAIAFELLPIDFQHYLAPSLVSYEEVFHTRLIDEWYVQTSDDLLTDRMSPEEIDQMQEVTIH